MNSTARPAGNAYFPVIVRDEHDSPIDALVAACVPRQEALNLVAASWAAGDSGCLVANVDGGRPVVVLRTPAGRWAACNAYVANLYSTPQQADRRLGQLLKGQRHGYVACLPAWRASECEADRVLLDNGADGGDLPSRQCPECGAPSVGLSEESTPEIDGRPCLQGRQ